MKKIYTVFLTLLFVFAASFSLIAQNAFFTNTSQNTISRIEAKRVITPESYRTLTSNTAQLKTFLWSLPSEKTINPGQAPIMEFPMPDGRMARFHVWESSIMEPGLEAKFPEMKTFAGYGIDDPYATIRFDYNPYFGFHAQILSSVNGRVYIDPYAKWDVDHYMSYYTRDNKKISQFVCETIDKSSLPNNVVAAGPCRGTQLYSYRLALACTGEYAVAVCSPNPATIPATAAAMLTTVNRVTGVYEKEIGLRMTLIANNNLLIYLDGATDPYTNNNGGTMLGQNQANIDAVIGNANYDIGHVVSTGGGGVANLRVPCVTGSKARGVTGLPNPVGDNFDIDYVAHEMGHQWGGNHTFNSSLSNCGGGNRNGGTAYEVGSGTTIQAYAGICGTDDIQPHSDPFFHTVSYDEISNYIETGNGNTCKVATATGNTLPAITAMNNNGISIPVNTPFTLTGTATDADNDPLTYCWEEWDLGPTTVWNGGNTTTTAPLFKSRIPKASGSRTFPDIAVILAGYPANPPTVMGGLKGETLPTVARDLKFRLTVRDVHPGTPPTGGIVTGGEGCQAGFTGTYVVHVIATTGPFAVTVPNGGESWAGGSSQTITWNVVGTDQAPISTANVKISMSTDGGLTYPTVIAASTPNDGSEVLTIPNTPSTTARIKVEAVGNVFFDISNANFTVTVPSVPTFDFVPNAGTAVPCGSASASITLQTSSILGFVTPINLVATGNPGTTTVSFTPNPVIPGNSTIVTLNSVNTLTPGTYPVTVTGTAGAEIKTIILNYIVNPGAGPAIGSQPSAQTLCAGGNTSFSITSASATSFQWQESTNGGGNWNNITNGGIYGGATTATLNLTGVTAVMNNYQYRCIAGVLCGSTNSNAVVLTVQTAPSFTAQPANSTVCGGVGPSTFSVTALGTGLSYQWQESPTGCGGPWTNLANGAPYSGVTTPSLTIAASTPAMNGYAYRCVVTGTCAPAATSGCGVLTVNTAVAVTTQPLNSTICAGATTGFTVAASGTAPAYQWQESTNGGANWNNIANGGVYSGATTVTLTLTGITAGMNTYQYRCVVSGAAPCGSANSNAAVLTVNTAPAITTQPVPTTTLCVGSNTTYTVAANGIALTYQWQVSTTGAGGPWNPVANGGVYSGATTASLTLTGVTAAMTTYQYRCIISGTCAPAATSGTTVLTVNTPVNITSQPAANSICATGSTSFTVAATGTSPTYQWQLSTTGAGGPWNNIVNGGVYGGSTTATLTLTGITAAMNTYQYRAVVTGAAPCGAATSNPAILNVTPLPVISASPFTSLLAGQSTILTVNVNPAPGLSFSWYLNGSVVATASGNTLTVTVGELGNYRVIVTSATGSCTSDLINIKDSASDKLFIYPSPNNGQFTVAYYNPGGGSTQQGITIYDSHGAKVYNNVFPVSLPYQLHKIDLRRNAAGIYYVVLRDANGKKVKTGEVVIR